MHTLSHRAHGVLDYLIALLLVVSPRFLNFESGADEAGILLAVGLVVLLYSLLTRYELGLLPVIPFRAHLALDVLGGLTLLLSPWLFGFADHIRAPHVLLGLLELGLVMITRKGADAPRPGRVAHP
jgi:hypothetical protein